MIELSGEDFPLYVCIVVFVKPSLIVRTSSPYRKSFDNMIKTLSFKFLLILQRQSSFGKYLPVGESLGLIVPDDPVKVPPQGEQYGCPG